MSKCDQTNKLIEIGAQLKQVRENRAIPLHQITSTTLIAERHLRAIEEGDIDELPEAIYIQGFIRKYGQALGMEELAEDFPLEAQSDPKTSLTLPKTELRPFHLYALYIGVIGVAISMLANFFNQGKVSPLAVEKSIISKSAKVNSLPQGGRIGKVGATNFLAYSKPSNLVAGASEDSTLSPKPIKLDISTTAEAWLSVNVDGKIQFEGTLPSGSSRNWSAVQEIKVVAGNAGAVLVVFNDQAVGTLGKSGEVVEKRFNLTEKFPGSSQAEQQNDNTQAAPTDNSVSSTRSISSR
jgi:cytoskeletal protein RodZ